MKQKSLNAIVTQGLDMREFLRNSILICISLLLWIETGKTQEICNMFSIYPKVLSAIIFINFIMHWFSKTKSNFSFVKSNISKSSMWLCTRQCQIWSLPLREFSRSNWWLDVIAQSTWRRNRLQGNFIQWGYAGLCCHRRCFKSR